MESGVMRNGKMENICEFGILILNSGFFSYI